MGKGILLCFLGCPDTSAVLYSGNDGESECTGQYGTPTEDECGCVASCDVNQPACKKKRQDGETPSGQVVSIVPARILCVYSILSGLTKLG